MVRVGIVGGSGYAGVELMRLLVTHPEANVVGVSSRTYAGQSVGKVLPGLRGCTDLAFTDEAAEELAGRSDVVFAATPHGVAMGMAAAVVKAGCRLIDLGSDFRFTNADVYEEWYGKVHSQRALLSEAVYGLPELHRERIAAARVVGNPGCYPTSVILACAPLLEVGLIDADDIVVDAKSGVSGGGSSPRPMYHFPECTENFRAYGVASHRHTPEIEQELSAIAGRQLMVSFTPHLVPMVRGIFSTVYTRPTRKVSTSDILDIIRARYANEYFIRVLGDDELPQTRAVMGSNFAEITARLDPRTGRLILLSAIDNLVKGAAGQAIQNMNILFGLDETVGLRGPALHP